MADDNFCIFNLTKTNCTPPNRKNIDHLICQKHLEEVYGLELLHYEFEDHRYYYFVGGVLRPVKGIVFPENCVIIPTRDFFDKYYRMTFGTVDDNEYTMNPQINKLMTSLAKRKTNSQCFYAHTELIRNLSEPPKEANLHYQEPIEVSKNKSMSLISARLTLSEARIEHEDYYSYLENIKLFDEKDTQSKDILTDGTLKISKLLAYFLSKCMFFYHNSPEKNLESQLHNCKWIAGVGLVATEDIMWSSELVILGISHGNQHFVDNMVTEVEKQYLHRKITLDDIPKSQFAKRNILKGGSDCLV